VVSVLTFSSSFRNTGVKATSVDLGPRRQPLTTDPS